MMTLYMPSFGIALVQFWTATPRRHPERSRFSGEAKDLPLDRPGA